MTTTNIFKETKGVSGQHAMFVDFHGIHNGTKSVEINMATCLYNFNHIGLVPICLCGHFVSGYIIIFLLNFRIVPSKHARHFYISSKYPVTRHCKS